MSNTELAVLFFLQLALILDIYRLVGFLSSGRLWELHAAGGG